MGLLTLGHSPLARRVTKGDHRHRHPLANCRGTQQIEHLLRVLLEQQSRQRCSNTFSSRGQLQAPQSRED